MIKHLSCTQQEIQAILFTCGEIRQALPETTALLENIIRTDILDLAKQMERSARRRGSKQLAPDDLFFTIRHNPTLFHRSIRLANWKQTYKAARDIHDGIGDDLIEDEGFLDKLPDYLDYRDALPWDALETMEMAAGIQHSIHTPTVDAAAMARRQSAAEMAAAMTDEEYLEYAECRRTSLTSKKFPKFRELCDFGQHVSMKPVNDMLELFGIYAVELIKQLAEIALQIKNDLILYGDHVDNGDQEDESIKILKAQSLFAIEEDEHPLKPFHIKEAYRRLKKRAVQEGGMRKANLFGSRSHTTTLF